MPASTHAIDGHLIRSDGPNRRALRARTAASLNAARRRLQSRNGMGNVKEAALHASPLLHHPILLLDSDAKTLRRFSLTSSYRYLGATPQHGKFPSLPTGFGCRWRHVVLSPKKLYYRVPRSRQVLFSFYSVTHVRAYGLSGRIDTDVSRGIHLGYR